MLLMPLLKSWRFFFLSFQRALMASSSSIKSIFVQHLYVMDIGGHHTYWKAIFQSHFDLSPSFRFLSLSPKQHPSKKKLIENKIIAMCFELSNQCEEATFDDHFDFAFGGSYQRCFLSCKGTCVWWFYHFFFIKLSQQMLIPQIFFAMSWNYYKGLRVPSYLKWNEKKNKNYYYFMLTQI